MRASLLLTAALLLLAACETPETAQAPPPASDAPAPPAEFFAALDSATVRQHLMVLSADSMEGRGTGTAGEERAIRYIARQMEAAGLEPAGDDGSFFQQVPLLGSTPTPRGPLVLQDEGGETAELAFVNDFIVSTDLEATAVETEAPLVFVGYGIDAPGYDWDSFKDVDVTDKIIVSFVNDPPATGDEPGLFQADTLTYYGRWTYKYEEARRRGAKGALLIHTNAMAGYPFQVLSGTAAGEQIQLATPPENPLELKGWITQASAERLARMSGTTLDAWMEAAARRDFAPQELPVTASLAVEYAVRRFSGTNVVGRVPGRERPAESIAYTAHHDHLGIGAPNAEGDRIYNGAVDNASGVAMLLALADAFGSLDPAPARSVYFVSLTAEESGLLGAEYFARNAPADLSQMVGNLNVDSGNVGGRTRDIVGIGAEKSEMEGLLAEAAAAEDMVVRGDPHPNQGYFFRSDQLAFARAGVPAVFVNTGTEFIGQDAGYGERIATEYNERHYHQPSDEFNPAWPMGGIVQQMRVAGRLGYRLATTEIDPQWDAGEAFAQTRAESRQ